MTAYSERFAPPPRLLRMASGGWLAVSAADAPIRIGVIGLTPDDARERFANEAAAWRRLLSEPPSEPRTGVIGS